MSITCIVAEGYAARDSRVDFVENDRRQLHPAGKQGLDGKHHAREFTARCDLLDGLGLGSAVGREEVFHHVGSRTPECCRRQSYLEYGFGHAQAGQCRADGFGESGRRLGAGLAELFGQFFRFFLCLLQGVLRLGDRFAAMVDGGQLQYAAVAQGDQFGFVGRAVFLLQSQQGVQSA